VKDTIFYIGGGKGGVGKSMTALTLVQFLIDKFGEEKTIHLIETDESNPDVGRVYKGKIPLTNVILDENEKGWIVMARLIEQSRDTLFVINSAARSNLGIRKNGRNFVAVLENGKLPYNLVTFWPMNRQRDSVMLLEDYLGYVTYGSVYPIRNEYFGGSEEFTLFDRFLDESRLLRSRMTKLLNFPALADVIADDFYTGGKTIPETFDDLGAFAGQSFESWRNRVYEMFESTGEFSNEFESNQE
jgi:hypothetical protein